MTAEAVPTVFVVDDDAGIRAAILGLLGSVGLRSEAYASPQEFLRRQAGDVPGCLVLDMKMPGLTGLELQRTLADAGVSLPTIFVTGHGDIPMTVQAMKAGAVEFLTKPFQDEDLLRAIGQALERDRATRAERDEKAAVCRTYESLTTRERQVMLLVVAGRLNKQIAAELGTSEVTVKLHRGRVMRKMTAGSVADLVRMASKLDLPRG